MLPWSPTVSHSSLISHDAWTLIRNLSPVTTCPHLSTPVKHMQGQLVCHKFSVTQGCSWEGTEGNPISLLVLTRREVHVKVEKWWARNGSLPSQHPLPYCDSITYKASQGLAKNWPNKYWWCQCFCNKWTIFIQGWFNFTQRQERGHFKTLPQVETFESQAPFMIPLDD